MAKRSVRTFGSVMTGRSLASLCVGTGVGVLVIADFYVVNTFLSLSGLRPFSWLLPYLILASLLIVGFVSVTLLMRLNMDTLIETRGKVFVVLLIVGLQTVGLSPVRIDSSDLLFLSFAYLWLVNMFTTERYTIIASPLHFLNIALFIAVLFSAANGGLAIISPLLPLMKAMVFSFLIIDIVRRKDLTLFFLKMLVVVTTASAAIGIVQEIVYLLSGTILMFYEEKYVNLILESTPLGTFLRVPAFTGMHLYLANLIVISLLTIVNYLLYFGQSTDRRRKVVLIGAMIVQAAALVCTFSKTSMFGLAAGLTISVLLRWRSFVIHFATLAVLAALLLGISGYWKPAYKYFVVQKEVQGDIGNRLELMKGGIEGFFLKHPFVGVGLGQSSKYTNHVAGWGVHNAFIQAADETGIFGFLVFCSLFVYVFLRALTTWFSISERADRTILTVLLTALVAYTVNIQFQPDFTSYYNWILLGFTESAVITLRRREASLGAYGRVQQVNP